MKNGDCIARLRGILPRLSLRWAGFRTVRRQVYKRIDRPLQKLAIAEFWTD